MFWGMSQEADILFYLALTWCQKARENHIEIESGFTMSRAPCQDCPTKATSADTRNTENKKTFNK